MFIVSLILFLGGFALFGLAFNIDVLQGVVFAAGIIAICLAMALPIHFGGWSRSR